MFFQLTSSSCLSMAVLVSIDHWEVRTEKLVWGSFFLVRWGICKPPQGMKRLDEGPHPRGLVFLGLHPWNLRSPGGGPAAAELYLSHQGQCLARSR